MASDPIRQALAQVEAQRDDAVAYLSAIREVMTALAAGHGLRPTAQAIAEVLVSELAVEGCAVALRQPEGQLALIGFATQAQRLGGPADRLGEAGWLGLAGLVGEGADGACFRRTPDGGFVAIGAGDLAGEGFLALPLRIGDEIGGTLVLHWLAAPAQAFGRGPALALVTDIVGQAITVAQLRDRAERVSVALAEELGTARRVVSTQEASLRAREDRIEQLTGELVRSSRAKREFLGVISHELRTPLNAILGYSELLREGVAGEIPGEQRRLLDRVIASGRNLNELVGDMLFFVQVEADRVLVRPQQLETAGLIESAIGALRERPAPERVGLRVEVSPEAAALHVDENLGRRILFHLLSNAFKFTSQGEVFVSVGPGEERESVVIVVRDTGIGMPPERVNEMFEAFTQADSSATRRHEGLGMGLTLVQRCVRLLGGQVTVQQRPEGGSEFRVMLPGVLVREPLGPRPATPVHPLH